MASVLKEWDEKDFNQLLKNELAAIVEFGATWCGTCKQTEPMVAEVSLKFPEVSFSKIDVAKNPGLASRMGVMSLPNILIINKGKVVDQIIGATNRTALENKIKKLI